MSLLPFVGLRYVAWLFAVSFVLGLLVNFMGFPSTPATGVILAAAPMVEIGMAAARRMGQPIGFQRWAMVWGLCLAIFAALRLIVPAILFSEVREAMSNPEALTTSAIVLVATGAMMALFLWIGVRMARPSAGANN